MPSTMRQPSLGLRHLMRGTNTSHSGWVRGRVIRTLVWLACLPACPACGVDPIEPPPPLAPTIRVEDRDETEAPDHVVVAAEVPYDPSASFVPASRLDDHTSASPVRARRFIFRFTIRLPWGLGPGRPDLMPPTGELRVDVAGGRLRARFVGNGFPVDDGSEVRMRSDAPGTYVFDGRGGRPYGTGQLAAWFQSGPGASGIELTKRESAPDDPVVVDLVCRLFGEWAGASVAAVRRACVADGMPVKMIFGPYRVDRTAEATIELPERALRADHLEGPRGIPHVARLGFHDATTLARLEPGDLPEGRPGTPAALPSPSGALEIENRTGARVLVSIDGVAVGWLDSGGEPMSFPGLRPGGYMIGAVMPLGGRACRTRLRAAPTRVVLEP